MCEDSFRKINNCATWSFQIVQQEAKWKDAVNGSEDYLIKNEEWYFGKGSCWKEEEVEGKNEIKYGNHTINSLTQWSVY